MKVKKLVQQQDRVAFLEAALATAQRQVKHLSSGRGFYEDLTHQVCDAVTVADAFPSKPWQVPTRKAHTPITACFQFTDWHIGAKISKAETEGFGRYNWQIAQDSIEFFVKSFLRWVDVQRHGYIINDCRIIATGDWVSGDIHEELRITNEFPLPVQTANAGWLLAEAIRQIAPHFENVMIEEVGGDNHGRLTKKPQMKQKAQNNMGYLVYEIANMRLLNCKNVAVNRAVGMKHRFKVGNYWFLSEHGDLVKSWMGIPYYGMEREKAKEAMRRMFGNRGFHYHIMGHYHQPAWNSGTTLVGGSLTGTDEYDHGCGRYSLPSQSAFLVGKHGIFNFLPFTRKI